MIEQICGGGDPAPWETEDWPEGWVPCCMGSANGGPRGCTCWEPVFDLEQQPIQPEIRDVVRDRGCDDCAYRPGSPERADPGEAAELEEHVARGEIFWCHQGIRCAIAYHHPDGRIYDPGVRQDYRPPLTPAPDSRPYKADGTLCAGWWARYEAADRQLRRERTRPVDIDGLPEMLQDIALGAPIETVSTRDIL